VAEQGTAWILPYIARMTEAELGDHTQLLVEGILDSMDVQDLIAEIEARHGMYIPDLELEDSNFETVDAISRLVVRLTDD